MLGIKHQTRIFSTDKQKSVIWDRWQRGEPSLPLHGSSATRSIMNSLEHVSHATTLWIRRRHRQVGRQSFRCRNKFSTCHFSLTLKGGFNPLTRSGVLTKGFSTRRNAVFCVNFLYSHRTLPPKLRCNLVRQLDQFVYFSLILSAFRCTTSG